MLQQRSRRQRSRQQLERSSCRQVNYLPGLLIVLLVLLQNFELHMCRQLMRRSDPAPTVDDNNSLLKDTDTDTASRRSGREEQRRSVENVGQPEEIFSAPPNDATDMSYDEYPMVVPKRAALLLDRLMVALHHALENEREGHRIGEFYANKNLMQLEPNEYKSGAEKLQPSEEGNNMPSNSHSFHMYSDDDPDVPDYDFKDLNQINRATGETKISVNGKELSEKSRRHWRWRWCWSWQGWSRNCGHGDAQFNARWSCRWSWSGSGSWWQTSPSRWIEWRWSHVLALLFQCRQLFLSPKSI
ncbi:uncharacterized protein LOC132794922 isoform X2 [Drosophila nasuta]|uniref:uncharacterized protein LOC132794922 isoform X2 n=1 Tax=Drosophila nasuta TaxID=42062 RepID=UPI00295F0CCF|nr:uncharacterized protein LOC132794922 isoform X2 [Drosophila nasuta]